MSIEPIERKQWIIARKDINMPAGKLAAQVAHASMAVLLLKSIFQTSEKDQTENLIITSDQDVKQWLSGRFTKVVLEISSEADLLSIYDKAVEKGLRVSKIIDSGLTVFKGEKTLTCVGLGPHTPDDVKELIGHLRTYR